ncbi:MAG: DUF3883 domain-containing protein [Bacilli bacterium]|nr:DUF3883 domain-containing protein [Bacilli bacterium]
MRIEDLKIGQVYKREDLISAFGGSFYRGMNTCNRTNTLVLISKHTSNRIYGDKLFDNNQIMYTGEGQRGDQQLTGGNAKLYYSNRDHTPVHLFVVYKNTEYTYFGLVKLIGEPTRETENDVEGNPRLVYRFPLVRLGTPIPLSDEMMRSTTVGSVSLAEKPIDYVVAAAIVKDEKVLGSLIKHGEEIDKLEFPGGKINSGNSPTEELKKIIKENLNIDIEVVDKVDNSSYEYKDKRINLDVYKCKLVKGEIKSADKEILKWIEINALKKKDWSKVDAPIIESLVDLVPRVITEEVDFNYGKGNEEKTEKEIIRAKRDYEIEQKRKKRSGDRAEIAVLAYEIDRLNNTGHPELADKVERVSLNSDDYGYDIKSYDVIDGEVVEIHIEVKSATLTANYIEFFLSQNELRHFKNNKNHRIYCLIKNGYSYKLHVINKDDFIRNESDYIDPISYKVKIKISD